MTVYERVLVCLRTATTPVTPDDLVQAVYGSDRPGNPIASIRAAISKGNMGVRGKQVGHYANGYILNRRLSYFMRLDRLPDIRVPQFDDAGRPVGLKVRVFAALEQAPRPLTATEVAEIIYRGRPDGGPLYATENVSQAVMDLPRSGTRIGSVKGRRGGYLLERCAA
ncbi:hypothetical protein [Aureimonas sp. AU40]|uniref:hypothetical protein n=1 Tax=Aureimonas sp. AU40 TaxID=1637747 RepID=UPI0007809CF7|nr:hypothetical protein [Aureimonas sp. AU40]